MKHTGEARRAALRLIFLTLAAVCAVGLAGVLARFLGGVAVVLAVVLAWVWVLFVLFTLYFFRDPDARTPDGPGLVVCPGHGKVDLVDQLSTSQFPGGP